MSLRHFLFAVLLAIPSTVSAQTAAQYPQAPVYQSGGVYQPAQGTFGVTSPPKILTSGVAYNFAGYGTVFMQVDSCSSCAVTFGASVAQSGTPYPLQTIINTQTGATVTSITANGVYQVVFASGLWVTPTVTGTATLTEMATQ